VCAKNGGEQEGHTKGDEHSLSKNICDWRRVIADGMKVALGRRGPEITGEMGDHHHTVTLSLEDGK
jgi:hypothetical protein